MFLLRAVLTLHSSMVVCIYPIVLYCVHPRGKTVVIFSNKIIEKKAHAYNSYQGFIVHM